MKELLTNLDTSLLQKQAATLADLKHTAIHGELRPYVTIEDCQHLEGVIKLLTALSRASQELPTMLRLLQQLTNDLSEVITSEFGGMSPNPGELHPTVMEARALLRRLA